MAGLLFVALAGFLGVAECKRALTASQGQLIVLRPFAACWLGTFAIVLIAALFSKNLALYIATGALILIAWIAIPSALFIGRKIRREGASNVRR